MNRRYNGTAKEVRELLFSNPDKVYCIQDIEKELGFRFKTKSISLAVRRLYYKKELLRTPTQLAKGFYYTVKNKTLLEEIYNNHLLPFNFSNNEEIFNLITNNRYDKLKKENSFSIDKLKDKRFIKKYGNHFFNLKKTKIFLVKLVAFIMCDGNISKNRSKISLFFRFMPDAEIFKKDFEKIFYLDYMRVSKTDYCYQASICSVSLANLLNFLGAPVGNKIHQSFYIPKWIYEGNDDTKLSFLSVIYGNEGSAPSDNKWRIQFVLSKDKENLKSLLILQNQIKTMLYHFDIETTHIQFRKQKGRQFHGRFYIKGKLNLHKFYNLLEFSYASEKQDVLDRLILEGNSFRSATAN